MRSTSSLYIDWQRPELVRVDPERWLDPLATGSLLHELFEQYGFTRGRQVGKHAWIVTMTVGAVPT